MHKNPPPGLFDFDRHSLRYTIVLGLITGFILSIFAYTGLFVLRVDKTASDAPKPAAGKFEASVTARQKRVATPAPTAAVRY